MGGFRTPYAAPAKSETLNQGTFLKHVPQWAKDAFTGTIERVKLPAETRLYKISSHHLEVPAENGAPAGDATPWWKPRDPFGQADLGLEDFLHFAHVLHTDAGDYSRVTSAVRRQWNGLAFLITARLCRDVFGFFGKIGWQPRNGGLSLAEIERLDGAGPRRRLGFPGGGYQFYIPNMKAFNHITEVQRVSVTDVRFGKVWLKA
jgi:hypothetical protein